ncbi:MAG: fibronectin type III domain-containing protein [Eubacterium sp.]|uniref:fibronectin type III domain-containing protein n=1 Tax=Eubacterium sp. TaxID=142586 RepID=UPI003994CED8
MRKIFSKVLAGATTVALVASLVAGINISNTVKADDAVTLSNWTFLQGGMYNPAEEGNEGYINSVTMSSTNEKLPGWLKGNKAGDADPSVNQTMTAKQASNGFTIDIENTGWDAKWDQSPVTINPWSIQALMNDVAIQPAHKYTVSFKAKASKKKFGYVAFACDVADTAPYGGDAGALEGQPVITITPTEQTYTFTFVNYVSATKLNTKLMLGAFNSKYDYAGNDISSIVKDTEVKWKGTVTISDFQVVDEGLQDVPTDPALPPAPSVKPGNNNNNNNNNNNKNNNNNNSNSNISNNNNAGNAATVVKKLSKVKGLKAKNSKKGVLKISWKKVASAKKYQVKVGKKTYNTSKAKLTVKKLKKGKKYTIKVRATASGYTSSAWASKKVKIKK